MKTPTVPPVVQSALDQAPSADEFTSRLRSPAVAARVGMWLGICFGVCFVTGLISHYAQNTSQPIPFPASPSWGYRVTQGVHVLTGTACIPLLLVKLWSVYPKLFVGPPKPARLSEVRHLVLDLLEKGSIAVLVGSSIFQLVSGIQNTAQWYAWAFDFRSVHYAMAWVSIGALLTHIAVKLPIIRDSLLGDVEQTTHDRSTAVDDGALSRRGLLRTTWVAAGVTVVATAGQTVPFMRRVSVFAVRSGSDGHGGPPINRAAAEAGTDAVDVTSYTLTITNGSQQKVLSYNELTQLPTATESLPISCVEGWSAGATWSGVRMRDLLDLAGAPRGKNVTVTSLEKSGAYAVTTLQHQFADDSRTLLALQLNGADLSPDHGFPARVIAPDRPGVLQTKWVHKLDVNA